jgi:nicotinamidase/pyrazinamidase
LATCGTVKPVTALILADIQNDFLPGGALAVTEGDSVVPVANRIQDRFDFVVATQDWHPPNHLSFAANHPGKQIYDEVMLNGLRQTLWPVHCVQNSFGAELAPGLNRQRIGKVFPKGVDPEIDSYSGFFDNGHRRATGLGDWLKAKKVTEVSVCGLTTDYCVKATALDAAKLGFHVRLIEDACRGVNLKPGDVERAIDEMRPAGVQVISSTAL